MVIILIFILCVVVMIISPVYIIFLEYLKCKKIEKVMLLRKKRTDELNSKLKEHEYRKLEVGEMYSCHYYEGYELDWMVSKEDIYPIYVDSNNLLHNLETSIFYLNRWEYFIHGKIYKREQWEIERNRLLMLDEI